MIPRIKKIVAREFLIFIVSHVVLLLFSITFIVYHVIPTQKYEKERDRLDALALKEDMRTADSVRVADSVAIFKIVDTMIHQRASDKTLIKIIEPWSENNYNPEYLKVNAFGKDVFLFGSIIYNSDDLSKKIQMHKTAVRDMFDFEISDDPEYSSEFDGHIFIIYLILMILVYPVRLAIVGCIWAIKTLKN